MFVQILGSAAGGGFPQWNCNCVNCAGFRDGSLNAKARTQSSIAISDDGVNWVLSECLTQFAAEPTAARVGLVPPVVSFQL